MYDSRSGYRTLVRKALDVTPRFSEKAKGTQKALKAALKKKKVKFEHGLSNLGTLVNFDLCDVVRSWRRRGF